MPFDADYLTAPPDTDALRARATRADGNLDTARAIYAALATALTATEWLDEFRHEEPTGEIAIGDVTVRSGDVSMLSDIRFELQQMANGYSHIIRGLVEQAA